jgi:hypothetical protein
MFSFRIRALTDSILFRSLSTSGVVFRVEVVGNGRRRRAQSLMERIRCGGKALREESDLFGILLEQVKHFG